MSLTAVDILGRVCYLGRTDKGWQDEQFKHMFKTLKQSMSEVGESVYFVFLLYSYYLI